MASKPFYDTRRLREEVAESWVRHLPDGLMVDRLLVRRILATDASTRRKAIAAFDILKFALVPAVPERTEPEE